MPKVDSQYLSTNERLVVDKNKDSASRSSPNSPMNDSTRTPSDQSPDEEADKKNLKNKKKVVEKAKHSPPPSTKQSVKSFASMKNVKVVRDQDQESFRVHNLPELKMKSAMKDRSEVITVSHASAASKGRLRTSSISGETTSGRARSTIDDDDDKKKCKCTCFCVVLVSFVISVLFVTCALIVYFVFGDDLFGKTTSTILSLSATITSPFPPNITLISAVGNSTISSLSMTTYNYSLMYNTTMESLPFNSSTIWVTGTDNVTATSNLTSVPITLVSSANISVKSRSTRQTEMISSDGISESITPNQTSTVFDSTSISTLFSSTSTSTSMFSTAFSSTSTSSLTSTHASSTTTKPETTTTASTTKKTSFFETSTLAFPSSETILTDIFDEYNVTNNDTVVGFDN